MTDKFAMWALHLFLEKCLCGHAPLYLVGEEELLVLRQVEWWMVKEGERVWQISLDYPWMG